MTEPPQTEEGWFVLHDFRDVDWDAWRDAPERERERAISEGVDYLQRHEAVEDADEGTSAVFSVVGDKADLLILHLRPTLDHLSTAERQFESTALGEVTEQATSYVSVTEVSGYVSDAYFAEDEEEVDEGLKQYIEGKIKPELPDDEYVCFYPMDKRRGEAVNWYDLPFDERAELMAGHGETARKWGGKVDQIISSSLGLDDWEWGVTLFAGDATDIKDIVYELRFDDATSKYGEFGSFFIGRRFPPTDLGAYLRGETVPTSDTEGHHTESEGRHHGEGGHHHGDGEHGDGEHGDGDHHGDEDAEEEGEADGIRGELEDLDIYAGQPHGEDVYATVLYSETDADDVAEEVDGLRGNFEHYDTHVKTAVYEGTYTDRVAVVSIWDTASAAETAAGFLSDLPGVVSRAGEESGFGTMGMFYTVKPDYHEEFVEKFDTIGGLLEDMEGHMETDLMMNREDENDMFIASQWVSQEDAMEFFRSDAFRDTVQWGRDVLADRPRHVFLA
ncbi:heme-binding protein [Halolamina salifodinae]|uniref:Chlorite dismutase n=1 Tax=Halolamina salifodinae TaxID=1202767 RepID=A0A8T4GTL5_9EURY|nr:heme-binding protein [Halolamina salifodinae]MBP1986186.1 chlorite dismutase [Halolamina salifodinae]